LAGIALAASGVVCAIWPGWLDFRREIGYLNFTSRAPPSYFAINGRLERLARRPLLYVGRAPIRARWVCPMMMPDGRTSDDSDARIAQREAQVAEIVARISNLYTRFNLSPPFRLRAAAEHWVGNRHCRAGLQHRYRPRRHMSDHHEHLHRKATAPSRPATRVTGRLLRKSDISAPQIEVMPVIIDLPWR
jgi:hypothetical protein